MECPRSRVVSGSACRTVRTVTFPLSLAPEAGHTRAMLAQAQQSLPLPEPDASEGTSQAIVINIHCRLLTEAGRRLVTVHGIPTWTYVVGDAAAEAMAMVQLVRTDMATQVEVARAFGCTTRTVRRHEERCARGGLSALGARPGRRPGAVGVPRVQASAVRQLRRWKEEGISNRGIARRLGVCEKSVRKLLRQMGWTPPSSAPEVQQLALGLAAPTSAAPGRADEPAASIQAAAKIEALPLPPTLEQQPAPSGPATRADELVPTEAADLAADSGEETVALSLDHDPACRTLDRFLARVGIIDDAAPLFASAVRVRHAGVLLALPVLAATGVLAAARRTYGPIGPAFYGLRSVLLTLLFMSWLRIGRPEALKEHVPSELGRLIGLDRAPEVKTLRRKLDRLAKLERSEAFGQELAKIRAATRGAALGFLYVDGHVRVYHGKRRLPQTHVTRMRIALPATTDYWINDRRGEPLFVVTAEANAGLVRVLPDLLARCKPLLGRRQATVAFDRGGYSPALFLQIRQAGFHLLTYRKGKMTPIDEKRFLRVRQRIEGRQVEYWLHDDEVQLLDGKLRLRQVTRLKDGHQTPILTSRWDLPSAVVAYRMFGRWKQENYFKYMRQEFLLDALADYQTVADDPDRLVPNPERKKLDKEICAARAELAQFQQTYGSAALANPESQRPTMRGFKIANGALGKEIKDRQSKLDALLAKRTVLPLKVPVAKAHAAEVVKLAPERKHLTDLIKMVAYQVESDLLSLIRPHYARVDDEGRTLAQNILASSADIQVTDKELHVRVAPLSSLHRTRVLAALCKELDKTATIFPGTHLTLRFSVAEA